MPTRLQILIGTCLALLLCAQVWEWVRFMR